MVPVPSDVPSATPHPHLLRVTPRSTVRTEGHVCVCSAGTHASGWLRKPWVNLGGVSSATPRVRGQAPIFRICVTATAGWQGWRAAWEPCRGRGNKPGRGACGGPAVGVAGPGAREDPQVRHWSPPWCPPAGAENWGCPPEFEAQTQGTWPDQSNSLGGQEESVCLQLR